MQDPSPLTILYQSVPDAPTKELDLVAGPFLQAGLNQSLAEGIYLYRFDHDRVFLDLVSFRGLPATLTQFFQAQIDLKTPGQRTHNWLLCGDNRPTQFASAAWKDSRLERLPEFVHNQFETAIAIPLATGLLTAARLRRGGFTLQETASLLALRSPLEVLLSAAASREENGRLRSELQKVSDRLASRKHIERAKGIIQKHHGWREEEPYLHLWRLSRKTRKPMGDIARGVIVHSTPGLSHGAS